VQVLSQMGQQRLLVVGFAVAYLHARRSSDSCTKEAMKPARSLSQTDLQITRSVANSLGLEGGMLHSSGKS